MFPPSKNNSLIPFLGGLKIISSIRYRVSEFCRCEKNIILFFGLAKKSVNDMKDRLEYIKEKRKRSKVYYSTYNPGNDLLYDIEDADEDISWMIYEIERLRGENKELKEFIEYVKRHYMEKNLENKNNKRGKE